MNNIKIIPKYIKRIMNLARQASFLSDYLNHDVGAVIFDKRKIYVVEHNECKSLPMQKEYNSCRGFEDDTCKHFGHAEIRALHKLINLYYNKNLNYKHLSIFIYREHHNGEYALAKPCKACEAALKEIGIKDIYYTGDNSIIHEIYN
jgi:deoxycytidylate deaminase